MKPGLKLTLVLFEQAQTLKYILITNCTLLLPLTVALYNDTLPDSKTHKNFSGKSPQ